MSAVAVTLAGTASARADVQFSASVSANRLSFERDQTFEYRLTMTTGLAAESFAVLPVPDPMGHHEIPRRTGQPLIFRCGQ